MHHQSTFRKYTMPELNRLSEKAYKEAEKLPVIVVLDNVRSAHNVGSIFRTVDAFRLAGIYLCGFTPKPPHRDIRKTALGATQTVAWESFSTTEEALAKLRDENFICCALEQAENSIPLQKFNPDRKVALFLGNEVEGVQQSILDGCDTCLEIEQFGTKHSLNVSVSAGMALWHVSCQLRTL